MVDYIQVQPAFARAKARYLDTGGSDTANFGGRLGRPDRPYATLATALAACSSGETLVVMPGIHAGTGVLQTGVDVYLMPGAALTGELTDSGGAATDVTIYGGEIVSVTTHAITLANASDIRILGSQLWGIAATKYSLNVTGAATVKLFGVEVFNTLYDGIFVDNASAEVYIEGAMGFVNTADQYFLDVNNGKVVATGLNVYEGSGSGCGLRVTGGTVDLVGSYMATNGSNLVGSCTGGTTRISSCRLEMNNSSGARGFEVDSTVQINGTSLFTNAGTATTSWDGTGTLLLGEGNSANLATSVNTETGTAVTINASYI